VRQSLEFGRFLTTTQTRGKSMQQQHLFQQILDLSVVERIQLVEDIWDSVAANHQAVNMTDVKKTVLQERLDEYAANPEDGDNWHIVRKRIRQSL